MKSCVFLILVIFFSGSQISLAESVSKTLLSVEKTLKETIEKMLFRNEEGIKAVECYELGMAQSSYRTLLKLAPKSTFSTRTTKNIDFEKLKQIMDNLVQRNRCFF